MPDLEPTLLDKLRRVGFQPDGPPFSVGRPDHATLPLVSPGGAPVVAKLYPHGGGERCFDDMRRLWASSFGSRRSPPGLPRPVEYLRDVQALLIERVDGRVLLETGTPLWTALEGTVSLLADLHESDAEPTRRRDPRKLRRSIRSRAEGARDLAPKLAPRFEDLADALEAYAVTPGSLVPSHGDFSPRNVLVSAERLLLIDWDRFQWADPARDVAYFGAWCWVNRLRGGVDSWAILDRAIALYAERRSEPVDDRRMRFHVAAALGRIAYGLVRLWREDLRLVPTVLDEAIRRLR
jgi:hypothetical protein